MLRLSAANIDGLQINEARLVAGMTGHLWRYRRGHRQGSFASHECLRSRLRNTDPVDGNLPPDQAGVTAAESPRSLRFARLPQYAWKREPIVRRPR